MDARTRQFGLAGFMRQDFLSALLPMLVLFLIAPSVGGAQVTTNITSSGLGTDVPDPNLPPPSDGVYNITGGYRPGGGLNLFHSFGDFSVGQGDIANFLNDSGLTTSSIIGRVTGPNISNIYGTIQTTGFDVDGLPTNLFLVNPNGIVFGPNGSVNVGGSVSFSTAQYLRLSDGVDSANFYANPASDGLANSILVVDPVVNFGFLSSAAPAAYGFLTAPDPNATITVQGSALSVPLEQSISLVGGKVVIEGGAQLSAPSGKIQLATSASPGEFDVNTLQSLPNVDGASFASFGTINMALGSSIDVHGTSTVWIKDGQLVVSVNDATLSTTESPTAPGTTDAISLSQGSSIVTSNSGSEPGADIQITVGTLNLDGSTITTETLGDGNVGNLTADVETLSLTNFSAINSNNFSFGLGQGGNVTVQGLAGTGSAADLVTLSNGATITTQTFGPGLSSDVQITAATIGLDGFGTAITTQTLGDGNGGNLTANVGMLSLTNGAAINSNNFSVGADLNGDGVADVFGVGGNVTVQGLAGTGSAADEVTLNNGATLTTQTFGPGKSGDVQISAASIGLDGAAINTFAFGPGRGGDVELNAGTLTMENFSLILTQTLFGGGVGGDVVLNVGTGSLLVGASILSQTWNFTPEGGQGGKVIIQGLQGVGSAAEWVTLSGGSSLFTQTIGSTDGGQVVVTSNSLTMDGAGTTIISSAIDVGRGGDVVVNVQQASLSDGATFISAVDTTDPTAQPGPTLTVQGLQGTGSIADSVVLSGGGSGIISTTGSSVGAGDIAVYSKTVTLADGAVIQGGALGNSGAAGSVTIEADSVNISGGSNIVSQASNSDAGQVTITANTFTLDNGSITTQTSSVGRGGDVVLDVGSASLTNGASINTSTLSDDVNFAGNAGDVTITFSTTGNTVSLASGSSITSSTTGAGKAGQVNVTTPALSLNDATITTSTSSTGNAGTITATVGTLTLTNAAEISSSSSGTMSDAGAAGSILIQGLASPADSVTITDSSLLTTAENTGQGGSITVNATTLTLNNATISASVKDVPVGSDPAAGVGNIALIVPTFQMTGGSISAATKGSRNAGNIALLATTFSADSGATITSSSTGTASGAAGSIILQWLAAPADTVTLTDSAILTRAEGTGAGGSIAIDATTLTLNNATISASVKDFNAADASDGAAVGLGNVALTAPTFTMTGGGISAETSGTRNAGAITVKSDNAAFQDGATISSASIGTATGAAGSVTIQGLNSPAQSLTLTDISVLTSTNGPGQGGPITLEGANINLTNSTIATSSKGSGNAGDIFINSKEVPGNTFEMWHSTMSTSAALADGGNFGIYATNMVRLTDSIITSSVGNETKTDTLGGNVTIDPQFVVLQNSQIRANAFAGSGGAIDITATSAFIADPASIVNASSTLGVSGTVNIQSPLQNVGGELTALSQEFSSAAALLAQQCAARAADGTFSTFVVAAREGLPAEPGGFLASPSLTAELLGSRLSGRDPQTQLSAITGLFPQSDARPIRLAKLGDTCHR